MGVFKDDIERAKKSFSKEAVEKRLKYFNDFKSEINDKEDILWVLFKEKQSKLAAIELLNIKVYKAEETSDCFIKSLLKLVKKEAKKRRIVD